jgi:hypothetical protein
MTLAPPPHPTHPTPQSNICGSAAFTSSMNRTHVLTNWGVALCYNDLVARLQFLWESCLRDAFYPFEDRLHTLESSVPRPLLWQWHNLPASTISWHGISTTEPWRAEDINWMDLGASSAAHDPQLHWAHLASSANVGYSRTHVETQTFYCNGATPYLCIEWK